MKNFKNLKLHELRKNELEKSSLKNLLGGSVNFKDSITEPITTDPVVYCDCSADIYSTVSVEKG